MGRVEKEAALALYHLLLRVDPFLIQITLSKSYLTTRRFKPPAP